MLSHNCTMMTSTADAFSRNTMFELCSDRYKYVFQISHSKLTISILPKCPYKCFIFLCTWSIYLIFFSNYIILELWKNAISIKRISHTSFIRFLEGRRSDNVSMSPIFILINLHLIHKCFKLWLLKHWRLIFKLAKLLFRLLFQGSKQILPELMLLIQIFLIHI